MATADGNRNGVEVATGQPTPFVAAAHCMARVREALAKAAAVDVRLVLYGEPGTGKLHAARYLHGLGAQKGAAFVCVAAHEPKAVERLGSPEFAASLAGGTLVLEGVDEASIDLQGYLAAAIEEWAAIEQENAFRIRIVATAGQNLLGLVAKGAFRKDLHYLLDVFPIEFPPLRLRLEEVPVYLDHFHRRYAPTMPVPTLPEGFLEHAFAYSWPGNLRELENLVAASVARTGGLAWSLPRVLPREGDALHFPSFYQAKREFEAGYVRRLLLLTSGNVSRAAELAGKARKDFYALLSRNGVEPADFRR